MTKNIKKITTKSPLKNVDINLLEKNVEKDKNIIKKILDLF